MIHLLLAISYYYNSRPVAPVPQVTHMPKTLTNKSWQHRGINQVGQIVMDGYMVPFNVLKTQYDPAARTH